MKKVFYKTFRGIPFEFERKFYSSYDTWYHISVNIDNKQLSYRMHNKDGKWRITTERLPLLIYSLESDFSELLIKNEQSPE